MLFNDAVNKIQQQYSLNIKYKDQSLFMKILGIILFFDPDFMTSFTTTINDTIYYPSQKFIISEPLSSLEVLLHELVHIKDAKKYTFPVFMFLYLFPQILTILALPMFLTHHWVLGILFLLCILPLPAYFRTNFEKRAYFVSLYALNKFNKTQNAEIDIIAKKDQFLKDLKNASYYFAWWFKNLDKEFSDATDKILNNQKPFEDPIFDLIDNILNN